MAGDVAAAGLARWDGTRWSAVAGGVADPDRPFDVGVHALATDGTTLYVGGSFTSAGDLPVRSLAALDLATGTWSDPGDGVGRTHGAEPGTVHALASTATTCTSAAPPTSSATGPPTACFATLDTGTGRWAAAGAGLTDDGTAWSVPGDGVDGPVAALAPPTTAPSWAGCSTRWATSALYGMALFDTGREPSDNPLPGYLVGGGTDQRVSALTEVAGTLVAGGAFTTAASGVARFDPATGAWTACGSGLGGGASGLRHASALAQSDAAGLWVGGQFPAAGGGPSANLALWTATGPAADDGGRPLAGPGLSVGDHQPC